MEKTNETKQTNQVFGEPIYRYGQEEAVDDGILMGNPRQETFKECSILTTNLYEKLNEIALQRTSKNVFEVSQDYLLGCLLLGAKDIYEKKKFVGDNDENFFVMPKTEEGVVVWFVKNETGKLTAMLPEDY
jgi:hypothetical protein